MAECPICESEGDGYCDIKYRVTFKYDADGDPYALDIHETSEITVQDCDCEIDEDQFEEMNSCTINEVNLKDLLSGNSGSSQPSKSDNKGNAALDEIRSLLWGPNASLVNQDWDEILLHHIASILNKAGKGPVKEDLRVRSCP